MPDPQNTLVDTAIKYYFSNNCNLFFDENSRDFIPLTLANLAAFEAPKCG